jgi:hypothetical protein
MRFYKSRRARRRLRKILQKSFYLQRKVGRGFYLQEMIEILWFSFRRKDLTPIIRWIRRSMQRIKIKKHKKFLKVLKFFIKKYRKIFIYRNKLKGLKFDIRGKVSVTGNSKKRHFMFNIGKTGFSKKAYKIEYQQGLVFTNTGVLGLTMIITF